MSLKNISTLPPKGMTKKSVKHKLAELHKKLFGLQNLLFAENKHPILILLQGMDTAGKDGTIRHVFSCVNPMGCDVKSFKKPTELESKHDFLWRIYPNLPAKGMIQIFNRSHYEDILVPSVYQTLPQATIEERYDFINCFEKQLKSSGTIILKFYLHISRTEQAKRIESRKKTLIKNGSMIALMMRQQKNGMPMKRSMKESLKNVVRYCRGLLYLLTENGIAIIS